MNLQADVIIRIVVAVWAVLFLVVDFLSYCKVKINEKFAFGWGVFALLLLLASIIEPLSGWSKTMTAATWAGILCIGIVLNLILFSMCQVISQLTMKNQELAMQVSLLNNENYKMLGALRELTGKDVLDDK